MRPLGIVPPNGVRIHVAGIDLIRDAKGDFQVLEDNLRSPSGVSYVMENRRTMARVFPNLFATHRVRAVGDYSSHLLRALRNAAANNVAPINEQYVSVGVGRDYSDVSPLKGIYSGEGSTDLDVVVEITRLA